VHARVPALTAATLVASAGLFGLMAGPAHAGSATGAVRPVPGAGVRPTVRTRGAVPAFHYTAAGQAHVSAVEAAGVAGVGAVTLVDATEIDTDNTFTISQGTTTIGVLSGFAAGVNSEPQILPAGTYTATDDAGDSGTFTVTAGGDVSEVLYPLTTGAAFQDFTDNVAASDHASLLSFRNNTGAPVDVYVNDVLATTVAATPVGVAAQSDVAVPTGTDSVAVVRAGSGSPTVANTLISTTVDIPADSYEALYLSVNSSFISLSPVTYTQGYEFTAGDGGLFNYGGYPFDGSLGGTPLNQPIVGGAEAQDGSGYYLVAADGGVFAFGGAPFLGSLGALHLNSPIVGMATVEVGGDLGYYLVAADGGVFAFGSAAFYGSLGGATLNAAVVGIGADPADESYVITEANGTTIEFGPSIPATGTPVLTGGQLNAPAVAVAETPDGGGAWVVAADGGVFNVGDAPFLGSTGGMTLNQPIVGISPTYDGLGYALIARDGGVFNFGNSVFYGSTGNLKLNQPIVAAVQGANVN
jgi:hypothetical protein